MPVTLNLSSWLLASLQYLVATLVAVLDINVATIDKNGANIPLDQLIKSFS
jgi:hypothetical protein